MNVLVISHMYPHLNNKNSGSFIHEQIMELKEKKVNVIVYSPQPKSNFLLSRFKKKWKNYYNQPSSEIKSGVKAFYGKYLAIPFNLNFHNSGLRMYKGINKDIIKLNEKYQFDVIHAHVALPDGFAALMISKELDIPLLVSIHGQDLQHTIYKNKKSKLIIKEVLKNSASIIYVSEKLFQIKKNNFPELSIDKDIIINNGVSSVFLNKKKKTRIDNTPVKIISVSNLIDSKGINYNLEALSILKEENYEFIYNIIGAGRERVALERQVYELNLSGVVNFLGQVNRKDVLSELEKSDIFCLPSWNEGFGVVYIEAMAKGLPVIACLGEGIEDVITHKENGFLVKPHDTNEIYLYLKELIEDDDLANEIGKKAHENIRENFTLSSSTDKLILAYKKITGS